MFRCASQRNGGHSIGNQGWYSFYAHDLYNFQTFKELIMEFDQFAQEANKFIREVAEELDDTKDTDKAYRVTTVVLHSLRDLITTEESIHLVAQLPMFLKAVYVSEWHLPVKKRPKTMQEFIEQLRIKSGRTAQNDFGDDETAVNSAKSVLKVMKQYVDPNETEDIISQFPLELLELWATRVNEKV
jgi:uncharacterized protein (DUF2267 family)